LSSSGISNPVRAPAADDSSIDITARVVDVSQDEPVALRHKPAIIETETPGTFETHQFTNAFGTRAYKLYVPIRVVETPPWS